MSTSVPTRTPATAADQSGVDDGADTAPDEAVADAAPDDTVADAVPDDAPAEPPVLPTLLAPDPEAGAPEDARNSLQAASRAGLRVPDGLVVASEWTWRLLIVGLGLAAVLYLLSFVSELIIPVAIAILLTALLHPVREFLDRHHIRGGFAAGLTLLLFLAFIAGLITLVGTRIASGFGDLSTQDGTAVDQLQTQLSSIGLTHQALVNAYDKLKTTLSSGGSGGVVDSALSVGTEISSLATATFITLFCLFFFLLDGPRIWDFVASLFPGRGHDVVHDRGRRAYFAITGYVRATVLVAAADALGVFIVATILRVPLAFPLAVIVFIGAFVPIVGTLASGTVSVLVAFVAHGTVYAILMLVGVLLVVEVEGHVLQPLLLGRAVRLHPLAVFLSITAGGVLGGIVGIFFAVPVAAALVAILRTGPVPVRVHRHRGLVDWLRRKPRPGETVEQIESEAIGRGAAG